LTRLARSVFSTGNGTVPQDDLGAMAKWGIWMQAFVASVNPVSGALLHLPFGGGAMEQPVKTMAVWNIIHHEYLATRPKGVMGGG